MDSRPADVSGPGISSRICLLIFLGCVSLSLLGYHRILSYGLTDMDTLAQIHEGKVGGFRDLGRLVTEELTGGRAGGIR